MWSTPCAIILQTIPGTHISRCRTGSSKLIEEGALGQKTKRGVYQKVGKKIHVFDLDLQTYRLSEDKIDDAVKDMLRERDWAKKLAALRASRASASAIPVGDVS